MRYSPSIVPGADEARSAAIYFVLNDFGDALGRAWPEADEDQTDRETVVLDLLGRPVFKSCSGDRLQRGPRVVPRRVRGDRERTRRPDRYR